MKKKIFIILVLMLFCLPVINLKAGQLDSYVDWNLDKSIFAHKVTNGEHVVNNLAMMSVDGKVAYCIEPGVTADKASYYSSTSNINETNLKGVDVKRLSLIGYYGYGYPGHENKEYYMAAQELIWRHMGVNEVYWSSDKAGNNIINIDYYKNQILGLVDSYEITPNFNFRSKYIVGDEVTLEDKNNVLSGYEVSKNNNVSIDGNNIKIKVIDGDNSFILSRKQNSKTTMFYYKDGFQTIGTFEFPYEHSKSYKVNYIYGKVIVNKLDNDTKSKTVSSKYATLTGAEYALYDSNNNLIETKKTDEDGNIVFDKLTKDVYTVREVSPSLGYTINRTSIKTFIDSYTPEIKVKTYETIIKNKIVITKVLDDEENKICIPEEGIKFGIYDEDNNLIKEVITDNNGNITIELVFGRYILKQLDAPEGIDIVSDRVIEVIKADEKQNITLVNHKIKEEIKDIIIEENDIEEPILPKTGKNINDIIFMFIISILGMFVYGKKNI